jgi:hypothetical protein
VTAPTPEQEHDCDACSRPDPATTFLGGPPQAAALDLADDLAIVGYAAHADIADAQIAVASWRRLPENERVNWRATADGIRMVLELRVGAELQETRALLATVLGEFTKGSDGCHARVSQVTLAKRKRDAGMDISDVERKMIGDAR